MLGNLLRNLSLRKSKAPARPRTADPAGAPAGSAIPVYLVGDGTYLFTVFAPGICQRLSSRIAGVISDRLSHYTVNIRIGGAFDVPVTSLAAFRAAAARGPVEVVQFVDGLDQYWGLETLRSCGEQVIVVDFLEKLREFNLPHTYLGVADEKAWWEAHRGDLDRMAAMFGDLRSGTTLAARFNAIVSADRRPLIEVSLPFEYEYFNKDSRHASLVPGDEEIFVDIGAAHGDTLDKFRGITAGRFRQIYAFEPTPGQHRALSARAESDPRIRTFRSAVGDAAAPITFYENEGNPFGSNAFVSNGRRIEVPCTRLDDAVEQCTIIKMDVEGAECQVLRGATRLIRECRPDMAITCYHYPQDMLEILEQVGSTHAYRHIALRHFGPSLYDSVLLFSDRQSFE